MKKIFLATFAMLLPISAFAADLPIAMKKGQAYQDAKPRLMAAGWKVIDFAAEQEYPEIRYCQQGGIGRCGISLTDGAGKYLNIETSNDGYAVLSWKVSTKLPK